MVLTFGYDSAGHAGRRRTKLLQPSAEGGGLRVNIVNLGRTIQRLTNIVTNQPQRTLLQIQQAMFGVCLHLGHLYGGDRLLSTSTIDYQASAPKPTESSDGNNFTCAYQLPVYYTPMAPDWIKDLHKYCKSW
ncbi:uncharacterized protein H6S33_012204 [Morchella sextelata]|uniref:uncharacterized protein n=1 Tax=Morchella sextelata TaxID=1174677 RepID=UPI001D050AA7|nr:uncharacterized protein H6S33_012204 [Morchella sextelata]KAH0610677.1 hypothetical protein H6S33_012204 [Morchella sextelata]